MTYCKLPNHLGFVLLCYILSYSLVVGDGSMPGHPTQYNVFSMYSVVVGAFNSVIRVEDKCMVNCFCNDIKLIQSRRPEEPMHPRFL